MPLGNNKLFYIAGGLVVGVILLVMIIFLGRGFTPPGGNERSDLTFWGVFDSPENFRASIDAYQNQNPNIRINYRQFSFEDYEKSLVNAFASGTGPDIFLIHNTWLPKHQTRIAPLPQQIPGEDTPLFTLKDFKDQFVDVTGEDLLVNSEIYGLPIYVDTLGLYYNKDIFNSLGIAKPPQTWNEFNNTVEKITTSDDNNNISRSGAAIGTARNINRSTDILSLLMIQSGVPMVNDDYTSADLSKYLEGQDLAHIALEYYTDFANPAKRVYTWNNAQHFSIDAFQEGITAMMFNYSHQIPLLRSKAPRLNFGIASMPQLNQAQSANYASYWAPTVSKFSKNSTAAWRFLVYLSSAPGVVPYINSTNHPVARRDLIDQQTTDPDLGVFAKQTLSAKSWYQIDNLAIENILADLIDDVNFGRQSIAEALRAAENKITLLMQRQ
ncbi:MAG: extracellular solute-binding protein [bacterium]|nr:extracellular solute-binding protein [bacterium]